MNIYSLLLIVIKGGNMPNRDKTGPTSQGPATGRGFGPCGKGLESGRGFG